MPQTIAIVDYGSQYTRLIARRARELGVYAEILPPHAGPEAVTGGPLMGVVLSGGPASVYEPGAPKLNPAWLAAGVPVLGICYGLQLLTQHLGGQVVSSGHREFGAADILRCGGEPLFADLGAREEVWMSHGDRVETLAPGFAAIATTPAGILAAAADPARQLWGVQFHPEVTHSPKGQLVLANFLFKVCGCTADWDLGDYTETMCTEIRAQVGDAPVVSLVSGGVDSTVATALLLRALPAAQIHAIHIDSGMMRRSESSQVMASLRALGLTNLHLIEAEADFLGALAGLSEPEAKRHAIGDTFVRSQAGALAGLGVGPGYFLCQGTLYTDLIESGHGGLAGGATIKTHHNVGTAEIRALREAGRVVEPNRGLFKDEVRTLGARLGLAPELLDRHPFPGPGLGIRVLGEVTREKLALLAHVDEILIQELRARGLYAGIWQAFAVLPDVRSVGVMGDQRTYEHVVALRAVTSIDGMTADCYAFPWEHLTAIARRITNEVRGVNRVVYDVSSKPPSTIEWE